MDKTAAVTVAAPQQPRDICGQRGLRAEALHRPGKVQLQLQLHGRQRVHGKLGEGDWEQVTNDNERRHRAPLTTVLGTGGGGG